MNPVRLAVIGGMLAAVSALALWLPHLASGAPDPHEQAVLRDYSYKGGSNCASRKDYSDPIGVLFIGDYAGFANVSDQIGTHTDWDHAGGGSPDQQVWVRTESQKYECRTQNGDRANKGLTYYGSQDRYHVRLWHVPYGPPKTAGTPHYEEQKSGIGNELGHCVPPGGFDKGRRNLAQQFKDSHRHKVKIVNWGNTAPLTKCGKTVRSNGQVAIIYVNHKNHYGQP
jgi:hypothetical protein